MAIKISESTENNEELVARIIDQRLSLNTLNQLLDSYKEDQDVSEVITELAPITVIFDKVESTSSKTVAVKDENGKTTLKSSSTSTLADEEYAKLIIAVSELRNKITNN